MLLIDALTGEMIRMVTILRVGNWNMILLDRVTGHRLM
jgi:hypothetical protein